MMRFRVLLIPFFILPFTLKAQLFFIDGTDTSDFVYYPKRIAELDRLIQLDSNRYEYYFKRANMNYKLKNYEKCISDFQLINRKFGEDETALNNMALAYGFMKDSVNAIPNFKRSLELRPEDPMNWLNAGYILLMFDQYERAIPYLNKAIELRNTYVKAFYFKGYAYMKLGNYDEAKTHFSEALRLNTIYPEATFNLGYIAFEEKKYREALPYFSAFIDYGFRLNKTYIAEAYLFRAKCYLELGEKSNATADQEKAAGMMTK